ncbi:MAG TPA: protein-disulfide reductase DsbD domain-containing protein [Rubricoccaceae bacterium]|jgi:thiol:disulfide interchange protein DsbD
MSRPLLLLAALVAASAAHAQAPPRAADVVAWTARAEGGRRGAEARVVFEATVAPGWKLYALDSAVGRPLSVSLDALPDGVSARAPRQSEPVRAHDAAFDAEASTFSGTARIVQPLRVGRATARGRHAVTGAVRYAVCDHQICLPPATAPFRVTLAVR